MSVPPDSDLNSYYAIMDYIANILTVSRMSLRHTGEEFAELLTAYINRNQTTAAVATRYNNVTNKNAAAGDNTSSNISDSRVKANIFRNNAAVAALFLNDLQNVKPNIDFWSGEIARLDDLMTNILGEFQDLRKRRSIISSHHPTTTTFDTTDLMNFVNCNELLLKCKQRIVNESISIKVLTFHVDRVIKHAAMFIENAHAAATEHANSDDKPTKPKIKTDDRVDGNID